MKILIAGGAGYIGSVMVRRLLKEGHRVVVVDNLATGHRQCVPYAAAFEKADLRDARRLAAVFDRHRVDAVMHFAASSLVGESVQKPLLYFENNVGACLTLLTQMQKAGVRDFIFSSTAAVFGEPKRIPIREKDPIAPINPYGQSKRMVEVVLETLAAAGHLRFVALRYFNAAGAASDESCGEWHDPENHLIPNILKTLTGEKKEVLLFGDDFPTPDGTCIRDYVHVEDLAQAHLLALKALRSKKIASGIFNLGTSRGNSVMEIVRMVERVTGRRVPYRIVARRPGDPARLIADPSKARRVLGWKPRFRLEDIVRTAWNWECRPNR